MSRLKTEAQTLAYNELSSSKKGIELISLAEAEAAMLVFDLKGDINEVVAASMTPNEVYTAVEAADSLTFSFKGTEFSVAPYIAVTDKQALDLLEDATISIRQTLLNSHIAVESDEHLPGATKGEILDVCVPDYIGDYTLPEETTEWPWIEKNSCYSHGQNGESGVWEFVMNISHVAANIPPALEEVFKEASSKNCTFILFHQGT
jgi:hypothetical protein